MTYIGVDQVARLATSIHDHNWDAVAMVAIAGAESGYDTTAHSPTDDWGLWQINQASWPNLFQNYNWANPQDNLAMAHHVYIVQGITAWSTYTNGAYLSHMNEAQQAVNRVGGQPFSGNPSPSPTGLPYGGAEDSTPVMDLVAGDFLAASANVLYWAGGIDRL